MIPNPLLKTVLRYFYADLAVFKAHYSVKSRKYEAVNTISVSGGI